ncbi:SPOR domain-containing protein [Rhodobacteraceae bacterium CCMM004]|nr:SPOR domain-containing protein [Rhodobacteraceae bacterium CCMM004]
MASLGVMRFSVCIGAVLVLSACQTATDLVSGGDRADRAAVAPATVRLVERDVEAPEVFQVAEAGLWDGRPSLGGVWVAHPEATDPERVIIRNETNDSFVIGALFKRERDNPGPRVQVSSDAAEALGMLAGQPVRLDITALRREEVEEAPETPAAEMSADTDAGLPEAEPIEMASLDAPASGSDAAVPVTPVSAPVAPDAAPAASSLAKPFVQIGIFSVEVNARNTATALGQGGLSARVTEQTSRGKTFWRVVVGPAATAAERRRALDKVKDMGFTDAYFVPS